MTPIILLDDLEKFIIEATKDIKLQTRVRDDSIENKERLAQVFKMRLPREEDRINQIPYILLQLITGKDDKKSGEPEEGTCQIRIIIATFSEDEGIGSYDVLNLILRIRSELKKAGVIGGRFVLQNPLEYIVYPDDTAPFYLGEIITNWSVPTIKREVEKIWQ